eukprot:TRINITY_DN17541_c0_g1_i2.p1 TRINITY_DN17541_c0_g1~~TRINITY_DN17541_c0_g1_i2.p1  ORF type:complete len:469 (-),score=66.67 TRINITY_DN17541_c0_g1_i2:361-1767(-)
MAMHAVVVVDPISTGATICEHIADRDLKVIRLWSDEVPEELKSHVPKNLRQDIFAATVEHEGVVNAASLAKTYEKLQALPYQIRDIICGGEPGVTLTNALAEFMSLRGNNTVFAQARCNKYHQSEAVRQTGLRAVQQALVSSEEPVRDFLARLAPSPFRVIVKPVASAGSEDVKLCYSEEEVLAHVRYILGKEVNVLGRKNDEVLVQEYLSGTEYIVDFVSRNGVHKCVAVWEYDKREANGGSAVYFGERPMSGDNELAVRLMHYVHGVLDAIGTTNGSTHSEVIVDANGSPCLVECNCRTNGGDGLWVPLAQGLYGYSQVSALLDAYLDGAAFQQLPYSPPPLTRKGVVGHIVSYQDGTMLSAPGTKKLQELPSHIGTALCLQEGDKLSKTIDFLTDAGVFLLLNDDPHQLDVDYECAHELTARGDFFVVKDSAPEKNSETNKSDDESTNVNSDDDASPSTLDGPSV